MCVISEGFQCLNPIGFHCEEKIGSTEGDSNDYLVRSLLKRKQNMNSASADHFLNYTFVIKQ